MSKHPAGEEKVKLWRTKELGTVDLLHATYVTQTFPRHSHDGFAVGIIEQGALAFYYRGENVVASAGAINLANPGEAHTGQAADEGGWTYRMFYLGLDEMKKATSEISGRERDLPFFPTGVIHDDSLAAHIRSLHISLEDAGSLLIEKQANYLGMLTSFISRHADAPPSMLSAGNESKRVNRVRAYLHDHLADDISLERAAAVACLSPFHFLRVFRKATGLTPHGYLLQIRVQKAKALLEQGWQVTSVASEVGFADQSHLTRHFKRITGLTPGYFSKIVQDR